METKLKIEVIFTKLKIEIIFTRLKIEGTVNRVDYYRQIFQD